jgi:hypothetical protein
MMKCAVITGYTDVEVDEKDLKIDRFDLEIEFNKWLGEHPGITILKMTVDIASEDSGDDFATIILLYKELVVVP